MYKVPPPPPWGCLESSCWGRKASGEEGKDTLASTILGEGKREGEGKGKRRGKERGRGEEEGRFSFLLVWAFPFPSSPPDFFPFYLGLTLSFLFLFCFIFSLANLDIRPHQLVLFSSVYYHIFRGGSGGCAGWCAQPHTLKQKCWKIPWKRSI